VVVTVHDPEVVAMSFPLVMTHFAVPGDDTTYVTAPVPDPPVKLKVISVPAVPVVVFDNAPATGMALPNDNVKDSDVTK
jgi:hypothetical protein